MPSTNMKCDKTPPSWFKKFKIESMKERWHKVEISISPSTTPEIMGMIVEHLKESPPSLTSKSMMIDVLIDDKSGTLIFDPVGVRWQTGRYPGPCYKAECDQHDEGGIYADIYGYIDGGGRMKLTLRNDEQDGKFSVVTESVQFDKVSIPDLLKWNLEFD